jgi:hypothetical protein
MTYRGKISSRNDSRDEPLIHRAKCIGLAGKDDTRPGFCVFSDRKRVCQWLSCRQISYPERMPWYSGGLVVAPSRQS